MHKVSQPQQEEGPLTEEDIDNEMYGGPVPHSIFQVIDHETDWARQPHDAERWLRWFSSYRSVYFSNGRKEQDKTKLRGMFIAVLAKTIRAVRMRSYVVAAQQGSRRFVSLPEPLLALTAQGSCTFRSDMDLPPPPPLPSSPPVRAEVFVGDTCDIAALLIRDGHKPLALNMANEVKAGGGFKLGHWAQEESLMRRSNYFLALDRELGTPPPAVLYPIPEQGGTVSPSVLIFRGNEAEGYPFLETPYLLDFVAVAAFRLMPDQTPSGRLPYDIAERTMTKIRFLFRTAISLNYDSIVLGALGCGAFSNPPGHIAELFRTAISEHAMYFRRIVFAIFDDQNTRSEGNVATFCRVLNVQSITPTSQEIVEARKAACERTNVRQSITITDAQQQQQQYQQYGQQQQPPAHEQRFDHHPKPQAPVSQQSPPGSYPYGVPGGGQLSGAQPQQPFRESPPPQFTPSPPMATGPAQQNPYGVPWQAQQQQQQQQQPPAHEQGFEQHGHSQSHGKHGHGHGHHSKPQSPVSQQSPPGSYPYGVPGGGQLSGAQPQQPFRESPPPQFTPSPPMAAGPAQQNPYGVPWQAQQQQPFQAQHQLQPVRDFSGQPPTDRQFGVH